MENKIGYAFNDIQDEIDALFIAIIIDEMIIN